MLIFDRGEFFIFYFPNLIKYDENVSIGIAGMGKHLENFRMPGKPCRELFITQFTLSIWFFTPGIIKKLA